MITPTWQRPDLLLDRCMPSVLNQTWERVEHIIVSDGPDRDLAYRIALDMWRRPLKTRPLKYDQLPDKPIGKPVDYGSRARNKGLTVATGDYVAYLDDDNAFRPEHLQVLMDAIGDADFAYSRMIRHPAGDAVGTEPPRHGTIDTSLILHRRGLEELGAWPMPDEMAEFPRAPDWGVVQRWLNAGATWVHVPVITVDYYTSA